ncbi:hypothetical protein OSB04_un000124 [Centaurea solstitialis]|uniref:Reverse transcriptase zinc-binding domain-containing protein n=1 Tax=Centaurea solstitialis TaxID=347529 RepID=A0AA38S6X9_9ASTR|nr:hypothetical protein OSB04_un000124 [Centaurea solstitialis]
MVWRERNNRLFTDKKKPPEQVAKDIKAVVMLRMEGHDPATCVFCGNGQDSHDHLFFMCSYTREVWQRVKHEVGLHGFPELWSDILILLADNRGPRRKVQKLALVGSVYFIWMERNRRLFRDLSVAPIQLYKQIMEAVWTRLAWRKVVTKAR